MRSGYTDAQWAGVAFVVLAIVLLAAIVIRRLVRPIAASFIPAAVVAGFVILLVGPEVLGRWTDSTGLVPRQVVAVWGVLPGLLINVVFAAVMIGKRLPPVRRVWEASAPHFILGSILSFGQFALGCFTVLLVLEPFLGLSEAAGSILELSFAGGHGTIAGMGPLLADAGAPELIDLGLGLATISMITGVVGGSVLVRHAIRNPRIPVARTMPPTAEDSRDLHDARLDPADDQPAESHDRGVGSVTVAFMAIGLAIAVAIGILEALRAAAHALGSDVFDKFPLFPFAVIGGFLVQAAATRLGMDRHIERRAVNGISSIALDVLIACAIGTMSLATLGANIPALIILTAVALAWSVVVVLYLGPRIHPRNWFERAIADFGQSQGNVATGFVLADMADPARRTDTALAYGYKQLTYEPLLGGGLFTALSVPLIVAYGALTFGVASTGVAAALTVWGIRRRRTSKGLTGQGV